jgi:hypothetical protein
LEKSAMPKATIRKQGAVLPPSSGTASSSKSLMWMMIALFGGLAVLLGMGLFVASRAVRSMGLSAANGKDTIHTPGGTFRLEKEAEVGPGLPVYPRASLIVPDDDAAAAAIKQAQKGIEVSAYQSNESRDFVDSWYMKHLSPEFTRHDAGDRPADPLYADAHVLESDIVFVAERDQKVRVVALSENPSGTKISLIRFDKVSTSPAPAPDSSATPAPAPDAVPGPTQ